MSTTTNQQDAEQIPDHFHTEQDEAEIFECLEDEIAVVYAKARRFCLEYETQTGDGAEALWELWRATDMARNTFGYWKHVHDIIFHPELEEEAV